MRTITVEYEIHPNSQWLDADIDVEQFRGLSDEEAIALLEKLVFDAYKDRLGVYVARPSSVIERIKTMLADVPA